MTEIPNRIMLSEVNEVHVKKKEIEYLKIYNNDTNVVNYDSFQDPRDLAQMIVKVLKLGLEGLVLKDINVRIDRLKIRYTDIHE